ncbi:hypothetical protein HaLaN_25583, partial [Haematococcus lacustris]
MSYPNLLARQQLQHCQVHTCYCATGCWAGALGARPRSFLKPRPGYSLALEGALAWCCHLHSSSGRHLLSPARWRLRAAFQSLSTHLPMFPEVAWSSFGHHMRPCTGASNRLLQADRNKRPGGLDAVQLLLTGLGAVHS